MDYLPLLVFLAVLFGGIGYHMGRQRGAKEERGWHPYNRKR